MKLTTVLDLAVELAGKKICHSTELEASKNAGHLGLQMHNQRLEDGSKETPTLGEGLFCSHT